MADASGSHLRGVLSMLIAVALPWESGQLLAWVDLYLDGAGPSPTVEQLLGQPEKAAE